MWKKARKKPVVVEFREVIPNQIKVEFSDKTFGFRDIADGEVGNVELIKTREGELYGYPNQDYIIRGVEGELYPIKKDIFYKTYEMIE